jgi:hypothetical protein
MYPNTVLDINEKIANFEKAAVSTLKGDSRKVNPKIKVIFMKQLPITFPRARSRKPFLTEPKLVASSGILVPKAITVAPTTIGGIPILQSASKRS